MFSPIFSSLSTYASHNPLTFDNSGDESEVYQVALQKLAAYQVKSADPKDRNPWYELKNISGTITETNEQEEYSEEHTYVAGVLQGPAKKVNTDESIVRFTYVNGVAQGQAERTFKNGGLEKFRYVDGVIQGPAERRSLNGDLIECQYIDGMRQGKAKTIFSNNPVIVEFIYLDDVAQGDAVRTNTKTGEVLKFICVNGLAQGSGKASFPNGDVEECNLINGVKEGSFTYRHTNGDTLQGTYVSDVRQGKAHFSHTRTKNDYQILMVDEFLIVDGVCQSPTIQTDLDSGAVTQITTVNGFPQGKCIRIDANNDRLEFNVIDGVAQGPAAEFLANGVLTFNFTNGKRQGKARFVSTNKLMDVEFNFVDGESKEFKITDKLDVVKINSENESCDEIRCFRSGEILIYSLKGNVVHGPAKFLWRGITEFFTFVNGDKEGNAHIDYADGSVEKFNYIKNRRHGPAQMISPSGLYSETFDYFNGNEVPGSRKKVLFH